jgi:RNA-directed DNA polymerase
MNSIGPDALASLLLKGEAKNGNRTERWNNNPRQCLKRLNKGGDIRARWAWVEPAVWTERRLATLETGIEGGKWFRLIDKVWSPRNLAGSLQKVVAKGGSAGIDNQSVRVVQAHQEQTIQKLEQELRAGQYRPQAVKRVWIPKPGSQEKRPLGVPTVRATLTPYRMSG